MKPERPGVCSTLEQKAQQAIAGSLANIVSSIFHREKRSSLREIHHRVVVFRKHRGPMNADAKGGKWRLYIWKRVRILLDQALEGARKPDREIIVVGHRRRRIGPPSMRIEEDVGKGERRNRGALDFLPYVLIGNYSVRVDRYGKK